MVLYVIFVDYLQLVSAWDWLDLKHFSFLISREKILLNA